MITELTASTEFDANTTLLELCTVLDRLSANQVAAKYKPLSYRIEDGVLKVGVLGGEVHIWYDFLPSNLRFEQPDWSVGWLYRTINRSDSREARFVNTLETAGQLADILGAVL